MYSPIHSDPIHRQQATTTGHNNNRPQQQVTTTSDNNKRQQEVEATESTTARCDRVRRCGCGRVQCCGWCVLAQLRPHSPSLSLLFFR